MAVAAGNCSLPCGIHRLWAARQSTSRIRLLLSQIDRRWRRAPLPAIRAACGYRHRLARGADVGRRMSRARIVDTKSPGRLCPPGLSRMPIYADIRLRMSLSASYYWSPRRSSPAGRLVVAALGLRQVDLDAAG